MSSTRVAPSRQGTARSSRSADLFVRRTCRFADPERESQFRAHSAAKAALGIHSTLLYTTPLLGAAGVGAFVADATFLSMGPHPLSPYVFLLAAALCGALILLLGAARRRGVCLSYAQAQLLAGGVAFVPAVGVCVALVEIESPGAGQVLLGCWYTFFSFVAALGTFTFRLSYGAFRCWELLWSAVCLLLMSLMNDGGSGGGAAGGAAATTATAAATAAAAAAAAAGAAAGAAGAAPGSGGDNDTVLALLLAMLITFLPCSLAVAFHVERASRVRFARTADMRATVQDSAARLAQEQAAHARVRQETLKATAHDLKTPIVAAYHCMSALGDAMAEEEEDAGSAGYGGGGLELGGQAGRKSLRMALDCLAVAMNSVDNITTAVDSAPVEPPRCVDVRALVSRAVMISSKVLTTAFSCFYGLLAHDSLTPYSWLFFPSHFSTCRAR